MWIKGFFVCEFGSEAQIFYIRRKSRAFDGILLLFILLLVIFSFASVDYLIGEFWGARNTTLLPLTLWLTSNI